MCYALVKGGYTHLSNSGHTSILIPFPFPHLKHVNRDQKFEVLSHALSIILSNLQRTLEGKAISRCHMLSARQPTSSSTKVLEDGWDSARRESLLTTFLPPLLCTCSKRGRAGKKRHRYLRRHLPTATFRAGAGV